MSTEPDRAVVNVFTNREEARDAVRELVERGFSREQIGFAMAGRETLDESGNYGNEGAAAGIVAGASAGAIWGLGIAAGVLPVLGPAIAGGTLAAVLASAAAGAAAVGFVGTMIGMGIPREEAEYYEAELLSNRAIVAVKAQGRDIEAMDVMARHGGYARGSSIYAESK